MKRNARDGLALLLVLVALVAIGSAAGVLLGAMTRSQTDALIAREECLLDGLRTAGESCSLDWLGRSAATAALPPEGGGLTILDAGWEVDATRVGLRIVAYDRLGMLPHDLATPGGPLQAAVDPVLRRHLLARQPPAPGSADELLAWIEVPAGWRRFPDPRTGAADRCLATRVAPDGDGRINLNTAPAELLEAAFAALRLDGAAPVLQRRRHAGASGLPDGWATTASSAANLGVRLVTTSDRWSFLLTARAGAVVSSWWLVATGNPDGGAIVLRHAVVE